MGYIQYGEGNVSMDSLHGIVFLVLFLGELEQNKNLLKRKEGEKWLLKNSRQKKSR